MKVFKATNIAQNLNIFEIFKKIINKQKLSDAERAFMLTKYMGRGAGFRNFDFDAIQCIPLEEEDSDEILLAKLEEYYQQNFNEAKLEKEEEQYLLELAINRPHENTFKFNKKAFNISVYKALLPLLEGLNIPSYTHYNPKSYAYKLAVLFSNASDALDYLNKCQKQYSEDLVRNACDFKLPRKGDWDFKRWKQRAARYMPDGRYKKIIPYMAKIDEWLKDKKNVNEIKEMKDAIGRELFRKLEKKLAEEFEKPQHRAEAERQAVVQGIPFNVDSARQKFIKEHSDYKKLEANLQSNIKTHFESLKGLYEIAIRVAYKRFNENPEAARLFFEENIPESTFNSFLECHPGNNAESIPDVTIMGETIGHKKFYLKKMSSNNPRVAVLGSETGNCQVFGKEAEACIRHGITSNGGGFYVLYEMQSGNPKANDPVVAMSWAWRGKQGNLVLDSIEAQVNFKEKHPDVVKDFFVYMAHKLVTEHPIERVYLGCRSATQVQMDRFSPLAREEPSVDCPDHRDSRDQSLLADKYLPVAQVYFGLNKQELKEDKKQNEQVAQLLLKSLPIPNSKEKLHEWCQMCLRNKREDLIALPHIQEKIKALRTVSSAPDEFYKYINPLNKDLEKAYKEKDWDKLKALIKQGAYIDYPIEGITLLYDAALWNKLDLAIFLIENGANVNFPVVAYPGWIWSTPLHIAVSNFQSIQLIKLLLDNNADVNLYDGDGETPLHKAVLGCHVEFVRMLLEQYHADPNINGKFDLSPLYIVKTKLEEKEVDELLAIALLLLSHGAKVNPGKIETQGIDRYISSDYPDIEVMAIKRDRRDILKLMLQQKVDKVNARILGKAINVGEMSVLNYILEFPFDNINVFYGNLGEIGYQKTVLHDAVVSNNPNKVEIVKRLIMLGALPNIPDSNGDTAFELASPELQAVIQQVQMPAPAPLTFAATLALDQQGPHMAAGSQSSDRRVATNDKKENKDKDKKGNRPPNG